MCRSAPLSKPSLTNNEHEYILGAYLLTKSRTEEEVATRD